MADQESSRELPQRVRGAARGGSASSATPALSEETRRRIQAAIKAERAEVTDQDREPSQDQKRLQDQRRSQELARRDAAAGPAGGATSPAGKEINGKRKHALKSEPAGKADHLVKPERSVKAEHAVRPEPAVNGEHAVQSERNVKQEGAVGSERFVETGSVEPEHAVKLEPVGNSQLYGYRSANHKPAVAGQDRPVRPEARVRKKPGGRRSKARMVAVALVVIVIGSLGTAMAIGISNRSGDSHNGQGSAALLRQELLARGQAATWVADQVDRDSVVSCDRVMCAALTAAGYPSGKLRVLELTSLAPVTSAVVVVTAAVRNMFGSSLGIAYAPAVLASFGSGAAEVSIRVIAPHGALAYQRAFNADLAAREAFGVALQNNPRITVSTAIGKQLAAGQVDSRLMLSLADLASYQPIQILDFGNIGLGASADIPFRFADLAVNDPAAGPGSSAYTQAMHVYLGKQSVRYRPASSQVITPQGGQTVFRVEFTAPSLPGLLNHQ